MGEELKYGANWGNPEFDASMIRFPQEIDSLYYGGLVDGVISQEALNKGKEPIIKAGKAWMRKDRGTTTDEFASGTTYSSTSGNLPIFPLYVEPGITDYTMKDHPMYSMIQKKPVTGKFVEFNYRSAKPTAAFKYERAGMAESDDTIARSTVQVKFAYAVGKITGPAEAIWNSIGTRRMQEEISVQREALLDLIEQAIISGSASSYAYEFSGFDTLISSNYINKSSTAVDIDDIRTGIRYAKQRSMTSVAGTGHPNIMVTNYATFDDVKAQIQPWQRFNDTTLLNWGIENFSIDGIPMIVDPFASITANAKVIYVLDLRSWEVCVLQDITYRELPADGDFTKFMLKWYGCLNCKDEKSNCRIYGIA